MCDTNDFIRIDSKTGTTADGPRKLNVTVIGDPCMAPKMLHMPFLQPFDKRTTTIAAEAREVRARRRTHVPRTRPVLLLTKRRPPTGSHGCP